MASRNGHDLGQSLKRIRHQNGWKIADVARMTGLAVSTISKVENGRMSLTYDKLPQLAEGLSLDLADILAASPQPRPAPAGRVTGRRSVCRASDSFHIAAGDYNYWYLNVDLAHKAIVPILGETTAKSIEEFGELIRHEGEEFCYVLEGNLLVYTEFYSPVRLVPGECIYIDSTMGHAYIAVDCDKARFLCGCSVLPSASHERKAPAAESRPPMHAEAEASGRTKPRAARTRKTT
jgi:transcriptional regulator with XRE-family HTH domain